MFGVCYAVVCVLFSFAMTLMGMRYLFAYFNCSFLMFCDCLCSLALLNGAAGWSEVCECGIS